LGVLLAACTDKESATKTDGSSRAVVQVKAGETTCELSTTTAKAGTLTFEIENVGTSVTEFYLYAENGTTIRSEAENIGPGLTRKLVVEAQPGSYVTSCRPGMTGDGIRGDFEVTGTAPATGGADDAARNKAIDEYRNYVIAEVDELVEGTDGFAAVYIDGNENEARALYAPVRMHWERIEPVAESFGDIDPKIDLREADLAPGAAWTGWHRIEKDLWPPAAGYTKLDEAGRAELADQLMADTDGLNNRVAEVDLTVDQIANGAKELLDEVATTKLTGEEEIWSHTDLWDVDANVEGARAAFDALQPLLEKNDPELQEEILGHFESVDQQLDKLRSGDGFKYFDDLSTAEVKALSDAIAGLAEPLSHLAAAVVG
jgi:iron uptake system component EfeO